MSTLTVTFKLLRNEQWVPLADCLADVPGMVQDYLQIPGLHCCDIQGGFFIDIDGVAWSDDGTVDEFPMTLTWFPALERLWAGSPQERVWPWEESQLTLTRRGAWLEMADIHPTSGHVAMPKVVVPFAEFTVQLVREGQQFARWVAQVQAELARRAQTDPAADAQKLQTIADQLPTDLNPVLAQLEKHLAAPTATIDAPALD